MAAPLRVLRIVTRMNIGGPALHVALLSNDLDPAGYTTHLVMGEPDATEGDLSALVRQPPVTVTCLKALRRPAHPGRDAIALCQLLRLVWQTRPQIIHTHMAKAGALGRLAGLLYNHLGPGRLPGQRAKLVHTFHGHVLDGYFSPSVSRLFLGIERRLARGTDALIAVSETVRRELLGKGIGRPGQWRIIALGLDLSPLAALPYPTGDSPVRVGIVGRLVPIKNPHLFLEAFQALAGDGRGQALLGRVVGDGTLRPGLERRAQELGLDRLIHFTGWQQDPRTIYESLDAVCLTSWNEGTPVALIEAMAAGRAVIATDVGGVRDLLAAPEESAAPIAPGRFHVAQRGILIRPGDAAGLAAGLRHLTEQPGLRQQLATTGRGYVLSTFGRQRLLRAVASLYQELCTGVAPC